MDADDLVKARMESFGLHTLSYTGNDINVWSVTEESTVVADDGSII